ncbi:hypothetical protein A3SI_10074 [Nitritalea halalkaliphila LW7]|uniref:Outer membrane protein beta-barrel domain-containing protein n=1 Tax=Nitritalea halalkaliphila LW7 TaxID=1189621 RepID=I5C3H5_9BACT|nr:hypothetical protein [Nitritalea halalkaliphila]EIM76377.1 hypothetical protein A3SI_10074 [Nitritalea halalkaliphila LW7]
MKKQTLLLLICGILFVLLTATSQVTLAQENTEKTSKALAFSSGDLVFRLGGGLLVDAGEMGGILGLSLTNELSWYLSPRFSINPSLTYFVSLGDLDGNYWIPLTNSDANLQEFTSGLFTDARFQYDLIHTRKGFRFGVGFGPSFQLGGSAFISSFSPNEFGEITENWRVNRIVRLGYVQQLVFDWPALKENRSHRAVISMSSFENYWPFYLNVSYRFGFKL